MTWRSCVSLRSSTDEARNQRDFESLRITYRSGGLRIVGFIYKPKHTTGRKLPAIVFNRGGTADFGAIEPEELVTFYFWAKEGFVVLASNYRGGGGSEGVDEWGGRDVDDVMNLIPLPRDLGYIDMTNLFMVGLSRGGPMTYMAIRRKIPVNAAAVIAGPTDLRLERRRAEFVEGDDPVFRRMGWPGWRRVWPDFERREAEHFASRSAVDWPGEIDVPLLLLHSRSDTRVPVEHTLRLAAMLQQHNKTYEVVVSSTDGRLAPAAPGGSRRPHHQMVQGTHPVRSMNRFARSKAMQGIGDGRKHGNPNINGGSPTALER